MHYLIRQSYTSMLDGHHREVYEKRKAAAFVSDTDPYAVLRDGLRALRIWDVFIDYACREARSDYGTAIDPEKGMAVCIPDAEGEYSWMVVPDDGTLVERYVGTDRMRVDEDLRTAVKALEHIATIEHGDTFDIAQKALAGIGVWRTGQEWPGASVEVLNWWLTWLGSPYQALSIEGSRAAGGPRVVAIEGPDGFGEVFDLDEIWLHMQDCRTQRALHELFTTGGKAL